MLFGFNGAEPFSCSLDMQSFTLQADTDLRNAIAKFKQYDPDLTTLIEQDTRDAMQPPCWRATASGGDLVEVRPGCDARPYSSRGLVYWMRLGEQRKRVK